METLTRDDLDQLLATDHPCCVSLYMPAHRTGGPELREDAVRFSNLIRRTEEELRAHGVNGLPLQDALEYLEDIRRDAVFWQHQSDGLAVFVAGDTKRRFRLPTAFREHCAVGERFDVLPLLPLLQGDGRFYVIAVSQGGVRLFEATRHSIRQIEDDRLPKNMEDALNIDEYQQSLQFNSYRGMGNAGAIGNSPRGGAAFHGHGGSNMDVKKSDELLPYFRRIDNALDQIFGVEHAPLVFAGIEYYFPMFKEACRYDNLVEEPITGAIERTTPEELHARAWPLVEGRFNRLLDAELERVHAGSDAKPHSSDLNEILEGARVGRVDALFIADPLPNDSTAGHAEANRNQEGTEAGDVTDRDLVGRAAAETLRTGGKVFVVPADRLPGDGPVAARMRWAVEPAPAATEG